MIKDLFFYKSDNTAIHLLRSVISSSAAFLCDFLTMVALVEIFHIYYLIGGAAGFIVGTSVSYLLSVKWVFSRRRVKKKTVEYAAYILLGMVGGGMNVMLLWFFTEKLSLYYMFSRISAASLVFFFNFAARKIILFSSGNR